MNTARFTTLGTERLLLRRFRGSDLVPFLVYRNDPEVARYQDWEGCTEAEARDMIQALEREEPFAPGEWFQFAIELKETEELVGDLGFRVGEDGRQGEVGYTLAREHWGRGYATEAASRLLDHAFGVRGLHRFYAVVDRENAPSAAVLERLGMRREGTFVENAWFKGRWSSEYLYATLRRKWPARGATPGSRSQIPRGQPFGSGLRRPAEKPKVGADARGHPRPYRCPVTPPGSS